MTTALQRPEMLAEDKIFAAMRRLAVNTRVTIQNMRQDRDKPVRTYGASIYNSVQKPYSGHGDADGHTEPT